MVVSLGLAGALDHAAIRELAVAAEAAGLHTLWLNDASEGEALAGLAVAAEVTSSLRLATGVIPVDRTSASDIADRIAELELPVDRLVLGIGSGASRHPLPLVATAIGDLQAMVAAPIVLGALGPKMRALAATKASGALLSWLTPDAAAVAVTEAHRSALTAERDLPRTALYARGIVDPDARSALETETARYAGYPSYAANFARLGIEPAATTIVGTDAESLASALTAYTGVVDEVVFRAITADGSTRGYHRIVDALGAAL